MLYFGCRLDPVRLTEHLRGTRKSEHKKKACKVGLQGHTINGTARLATMGECEWYSGTLSVAPNDSNPPPPPVA